MVSFRKLSVLAVAVLCLSSCGKGDKVIPRSTMAEIYTEMFISDYWIREHYNESKIADTTRFYEPIFNKYGYTTLDFIHSADHYLKDPRRFARIIQNSVSKLDAEAKRLEQLSWDISSRETEIETYKASARIPKVFYDSLFFASAGWGGVEIMREECGAYMPVFGNSVGEVEVRDTLEVHDILEVRSKPLHKRKQSYKESDERTLLKQEEVLTLE